MYAWYESLKFITKGKIEQRDYNSEFEDIWLNIETPKGQAKPEIHGKGWTLEGTFPERVSPFNFYMKINKIKIL